MRRIPIISVVLLLTVVLLIGGGVLALRVKRSWTPAAVNFPDGIRVEFVGAVPSATPFSFDKPWARPLRNLLPSRWQGWLPGTARITCGSGNTNHATLFFKLAPAMAGTGGSYPWTWLSAVDDDGFRYPLDGGSCSTSISSGDRIYGVTIRGFPRRQKTFRVDFLGNDHKALASIRVPNPFATPPVEQNWNAEVLPITHTNGDLALTLVSAKEGTNEWGSYFTPKWKTTAGDPRWKNTRMGYLLVADPVGNEGGFLSRKEAVWKLRTTVHRKRAEDFDATERMIVTNLVLPAPGEMRSLDVTQSCAGVEVVLEGFFGAGTLYITNGATRQMTKPLGASSGSWSKWSDGKTTVESQSSPDPFLLISVTGMNGDDEVRLSMRDENARAINVENNSGYRGRTLSRLYRYAVQPTNDFASASLEIIVSRPKEFVFYINPGDIQPPSVKSK